MIELILEVAYLGKEFRSNEQESQSTKGNVVAFLGY